MGVHSLFHCDKICLLAIHSPSLELKHMDIIPSSGMHARNKFTVTLHYFLNRNKGGQYEANIFFFLIPILPKDKIVKIGMSCSYFFKNSKKNPFKRRIHKSHIFHASLITIIVGCEGKCGIARPSLARA